MSQLGGWHPAHGSAEIAGFDCDDAHLDLLLERRRHRYWDSEVTEPRAPHPQAPRRQPLGTEPPLSTVTRSPERVSTAASKPPTPPAPNTAMPRSLIWASLSPCRIAGRPACLGNVSRPILGRGWCGVEEQRWYLKMPPRSSLIPISCPEHHGVGISTAR